MLTRLSKQPLESKEIEVRDLHDAGASLPALAWQCPYCGSDVFRGYKTDAVGHHHLQCACCNMAFCPSGECNRS